MKFGELKANWAWFVKNMQDDEPCSFPRREAKKRQQNKERKSRVVFNCDPETYAAFHREKERIMRVLDENPTLFGVFLCAVLEEWSDYKISCWKKAQEGESLSDA